MTLALDTPAGKQEFAWLQSITVGDTRRSTLFPALDVGVEWVCTSVEPSSWSFDARFFGQPMYRVRITATDEALTLTTQGAA